MSACDLVKIKQLRRNRSRMSACDLVKIKQRRRNRSRKGDGIGVARIVGIVSVAEAVE